MQEGRKGEGRGVTGEPDHVCFLSFFLLLFSFYIILVENVMIFAYIGPIRLAWFGMKFGEIRMLV